MGEAHDDTEGLLLYDVKVAGSKHLHVISDPCSKRFPHSIGNGLWQSSLELIQFFSGDLTFGVQAVAACWYSRDLIC